MPGFPTQRGTFLAHPDKGEVSYLFQAPAAPRAVFSLGHGAGAGMKHPHIERLAALLLGLDLAVLRYQFPFMERGGGRDSKAVSLATVAAAAAQAQVLAPRLPLLAGGHSFGGRMTTEAAADGRLSAAQGLVLFSYPVHAPGRLGIARAEHLDQVAQPMLMISGDRDVFVQTEEWAGRVAALSDRLTMRWLHGADHSWNTRKRDHDAEADVYGRATGYLADWLAQR